MPGPSMPVLVLAVTGGCCVVWGCLAGCGCGAGAGACTHRQRVEGTAKRRSARLCRQALAQCKEGCGRDVCHTGKKRSGGGVATTIAAQGLPHELAHCQLHTLEISSGPSPPHADGGMSRRPNPADESTPRHPHPENLFGPPHSGSADGCTVCLLNFCSLTPPSWWIPNSCTAALLLPQVALTNGKASIHGRV